MLLQIDADRLMAVLLLSVRTSAVTLLTPVFSGFGRMTTVRVLFAIALAALLLPARPDAYPALPADLAGVLLAAAGELLAGALMAFGLFAAFGAFAVAGKLLDVQSGLGLGSVYDPVNRAGAPLFATILNLVALAAFFGMDAHHALMRGLAWSIEQVPPGSGWQPASVEPLLRQFGLMFSLGVALIAPTLLCLLMVEVALAMTSRVLPQMNVFIIAAPAKLIAALLLVAVTAGTLEPVMARIFGTVFSFWQEALAHG
ncbi:flagellar biosynthetic protein FliR [Massilia forsythiae]|uniref:Flagellar biosynthetic protein FliR n=1 Tax=Massilia forsythiae TaxID=2728020 RepID=A0A7Z2ZRG7_9BURK|nr:flagellar biosynthetic protein FliR [Massilia forsythiae]QJD99472.1 flagellar biosynthetic protein FliR [Massilia forsythiae]